MHLISSAAGCVTTIMILGFCTDKSWQTVLEQSDKDLHCLQLYLHNFMVESVNFNFKSV